jgi:hypothetical protein
MTKDRKRDVLAGGGLLALVVAGVWHIVGREPAIAEAATPQRTVEAPAVNQKEKETMPSEEAVAKKPEPTSQEALLREENLRVLRDNAIRNLRDEK